MKQEGDYQDRLQTLFVMKQEFQAEQDLVSFSQNTHYISEWKQITRKKQPSWSRNQIALPESAREHDPTVGLRKEPSQKYDLKKWEEKMKNINKIEYPIIEKQDLFQEEEAYILPKLKINSKAQSLTPSPRPKAQFSKRVRSIIEDGVIQKKLKKFKKELEQQYQEVEKKDGGFKATNLPRSFMLRKHNRVNWSQQISKWKSKPAKELKELKKQLEFQAKRYSVPNLIKARLDDQRRQYDVNLH